VKNFGVPMRMISRARGERRAHHGHFVLGFFERLSQPGLPTLLPVACDPGIEGRPQVTGLHAPTDCNAGVAPLTVLVLGPVVDARPAPANPDLK
jgi:hypothetical protein